MARGRFISNAITSDKKINDLSDDTSRLAFTWLVTFADCEGRTHGDPAMVRSLLFPRRSDVTNERMEAYIAEWQNAGLVRLYSANGDLWIDFPNFSKHQTGLRKDHEAASTIPPIESGITTELRRSSDVVATPQIKISKDKLREASAANAAPELEKTTEQPSEKHRMKSDRDIASETLEQYFVSISGLPAPKWDTAAQCKTSAKLWKNPLLEIWELCGKDLSKAKVIIEKAYRQMGELTVSDPNSIIKVARSVYAKNGFHASTAADSMKGYTKV